MYKFEFEIFMYSYQIASFENYVNVLNKKFITHFRE